MAKVQDRPLVRFPQLCQIAKGEFDAGEDWSTWHERSKCRCLKLGFTYQPTELVKAITAVEHAHRLQFVPKPKPARMSTLPPRPVSRVDAARLVADIAARYFAQRSA